MITINLFWPFPPEIFSVVIGTLAVLLVYWLWKFIWSIATNG
jgi:uncharacterized membrane protein